MAIFSRKKIPPALVYLASENTLSGKFKVQRQGQKWPCLFVAQHVVVQAFGQKVAICKPSLLKSG